MTRRSPNRPARRPSPGLSPAARGRRLVVGATALALAGCGGDGPLGLDLPFVGGDDDTVELPPVPPGPGVPLPPGPAIDGRTEWSGPLAVVSSDLFITARDARGWRIVWETVGEAPPGPLPDGAMAVAVFLGPRPTGGYAAEIADVALRDGTVVVDYQEIRPPPDADLAPALTAPYVIRLVAATLRPVRYQPRTIL